MQPNESPDNGAVDVLRQIRDSLGDLPDRLAQQLRAGRETRFGFMGNDGASTKGGSHGPLRAVEGLLGAAAPFVPGAGDLAASFRQARELVEAWQHLAGLFRGEKTAAEPQLAGDMPTASTIGAGAPQGYEPYKLKASDWLPPEPPVTVAPPIAPIALQSEETADALAPSVSETPSAPAYQPYQLHPEDWQQPPPAQAPALPAIEPYALKPEDWRPQPFEVMPPEQWTPPPDAPEPAWMRQPPEIGFRDYEPQQPPAIERPDARGVPEGWADVKPLLPLSAPEGWRELQLPAALVPPEIGESSRQAETQPAPEMLAPIPETYRVRAEEWAPPAESSRVEPWQLGTWRPSERPEGLAGNDDRAGLPWPERAAYDLLAGDGREPGMQASEQGNIEDALEKLAEVGKELIAALKQRVEGEARSDSEEAQTREIDTGASHAHDSQGHPHRGGADESIKQNMEFARMLGRVFEAAEAL